MTSWYSWEAHMRILRGFLEESLMGSPFFTKVEFSSWKKRPCWHIWLSDSEGVYELALVNSGSKSIYEDMREGVKKVLLDQYWSEFVIRYYPSPNEQVFEDFSFYEKVLRLSEFFDRDGRPRSDMKDTFHESYYTVGSMQLIVERNMNMLSLSINSQDRLIDYRMKGVKIESGENKIIWGVKPGGRDRNVPGWELSWRIFDRLVETYCRLYRTSPSICYLVNCPGKVWKIKDSEGVEVEYTWKYPDRYLEVEIILTKNPDIREKLAKLFDKIIDANIQEILSLKKCDKMRKGAAGRPLPIVKKIYVEGEIRPSEEDYRFINKKWWEAEE